MFKLARNCMYLLPIILAAGALIFTPCGQAGMPHASFAMPQPTPQNGPPLFSGYRGITIGMSQADVRAKLGEPKEKSEEGDYFIISPSETLQIEYEGTKLVTAIAVTFTGDLTGAPPCKAVFGEEAEVKPDGGVFKMVKYPKAGFWISYNKTGGDDPLIMIAMHKM